MIILKLPKNNTLFEGTLEILQHLHPKYELHIITNGFNEVQYRKIENSGLSGYFNEIITPVSCRDQKDGIIEVYPTGGYGQYEHLWSTNSADYEITELLGGFYTVTVTDLVGCVKDTTFEMPVLDVECLEVPNAFTPNGDGINDDWQIHNIYLYPEASVQVFNKWGKIVFEITNGYNVFWDGTKNGKDCWGYLPFAVKGWFDNGGGRC